MTVPAGLTTAEAQAGLTTVEARARLAAVGPNEIPREAPRSRWALLGAQLTSPLVVLLIVACLVSGALGELADAIAIGVIVIVNAAVGYFQESRAEGAIRALRAMTAPRARVMRDGHQEVVAAAELVPDDVLLLEAGDVVAADAAVQALRDLYRDDKKALSLIKDK